jgi:hypothetical protein
MKTVLFSLTTIAILSILSSLNSCSGIEGDDPPETMQDTTPQNLPEEYVQWDSTRVDNSKSFQRAFVVGPRDSFLVLTFDRIAGIPATELKIGYGHDHQIAPFGFYEGDYEAHWTSQDETTLAVSLSGSFSGAGEFVANNTYPVGHCRMYKRDSLWVIDLRDVELRDKLNNKWQGKLSAVVIWR